MATSPRPPTQPTAPAQRFELDGWIVLRFTLDRLASAPHEVVADVRRALAVR